MGRWADMESDEHRLPEGFTRTGYDADEQRYYYRDSEGRAWEGDEGNRFGELHPVGQRPNPSPAQVEAQDEALANSNRESIRMMLPTLGALKALKRFKSTKAKPAKKVKPVVWV